MEFLNQQFSAFFILLFTGMLWGIYFDFYRVFRSRIKVNRWINMGGDLVFWALAVVLATPLLYWSTWLELRMYVWMTVAMGAGLYFLLFSRLLIPFYRAFWKTTTWFPGKMIHFGSGLFSGFRQLFQLLSTRKRKTKQR